MGDDKQDKILTDAFDGLHSGLFVEGSVIPQATKQCRNWFVSHVEGCLSKMMHELLYGTRTADSPISHFQIGRGYRPCLARRKALQNVDWQG